MTRLRCLSLCACLAFSLTAMACGSSNSGGSGSRVGDQARIGDTGTDWWVNVRKGAYYFTVMLNPSYTDSATGRAMAITFAQSVAAKLTSGSPAPATLVPALSEMPGGSGWTLDPNQAETANGVALATNRDEAIVLIDGGADPFFVTGSYSALGLAWEKWVKDPWVLDLKVWQMASASDATKLYTGLLKNPSYAQVLDWHTCSGPDPANPCP